jgi:hypothetical protein
MILGEIYGDSSPFYPAQRLTTFLYFSNENAQVQFLPGDMAVLICLEAEYM